MKSGGTLSLIVAIFASEVGGFVISQTELVNKRSDEYDYGVSKRTFLFGKLVLVPVLAALGLKFLALVPIVLSKIAVLSVMNFLSTNLNLLVSTLFGVKSFLSKHNLWAHDNTKNHSEWETFDYNQPLLQPSLRYSFMDPLEGRIEKPTKMLKVYNGYGNGYRWSFGRRTRPNDGEPLFPVKEQRSVDGQGKYKCYWSTEGDSIPKQQDLSSNKYDLTKSAIYKSPIYGGQLGSFGDSNSAVDPTLENQITLQTYYGYQPISGSTAEVTDQQQVVPLKSDENSNLSEAVASYTQPQPFSAPEVKQV